MNEIKYFNPKEVMEQGDPPQHHFDLFVSGEKVGTAELDYYSKPLPIYQVTDLYVDYEHHGKGYGSRLMDQVERWLVERGKPGILVDAILDSEPAAGMYQRRGWVKDPTSVHRYVFNWPKEASLEILRGYELRNTNLGIRSDK